jgi:hypothetical protein
MAAMLRLNRGKGIGCWIARIRQGRDRRFDLESRLPLLWRAMDHRDRRFWMIMLMLEGWMRRLHGL